MKTNNQHDYNTVHLLVFTMNELSTMCNWMYVQFGVKNKASSYNQALIILFLQKILL